jgi:hypothetical protein
MRGASAPVYPTVTGCAVTTIAANLRFAQTGADR